MAKDERLQRLSRELLIVALSTTRPSDSWVIERIVPWLEERHVPAGEAVYAEGAVPDQIYFVADGRVRFERAGHGSFVRAGRWVFGMYEVIAAVPRRRS